jgi:nicotinamidase-related amidase
MSDGLTFGPLGPGTLHLCIDMQNIFAEDTAWHTPWMNRVLPVVAAIAERHAQRTLFTRFVPPERAEEMSGSWRRYFERWREFTGEKIDPRLLELVEPLRRLVPPARVLDKRFYSPFHGTDLAAQLRGQSIDALVISGAETDLCVLAAVLDAVDLGLRVVIASDAICSSSDDKHDALMQLYRDRFSQQVEAVSAETILAHWR